MTTIATSLKLSAERKAGLVSHACTVRTLADAAERDMLETGLGHSLEDVRAYFTQMKEFRAGRAERPARLVPKKVP